MASSKETQNEQKVEEITSSQTEIQSVEQIEEIAYMPLKVFADNHALKYGIELMGGFFHSQEKAKHFADTEVNWHSLMEKFKKSEVK